VIKGPICELDNRLAATGMKVVSMTRSQSLIEESLLREKRP